MVKEVSICHFVQERNDYKLPWKTSLSFNISQKDRSILELFRSYLKCGTLRERKDGVGYKDHTILDKLTKSKSSETIR